jgi:flagellum-specific ATP synthase
MGEAASAITDDGPRLAGNALACLARALAEAIATPPKVRLAGRISSVSASHVAVAGLAGHVRLGDSVEIEHAGRTVLGEVVRLEATAATIKPFEDGIQLGLGELVWRRGPLTVDPSAAWKGRVIDALARPIDGKGRLPAGPATLAIAATPPDPIRRQKVERRVATGVAVIDLFTPLCAGQRIGVFAGSGVGKSTLLGMLARSQGFDSIIVALIGERGREVREFLDDILGDALARAIVVVATGDESPMMRRQAPRTEMRIAEHLRSEGDSVLLIVDSITRYAHALREVALASGEPPVARGYAPSVFADLPRLLERAGPGAPGEGAITGVFSVLVDGDDHNEPVADAARGILDGHIVLDRAIAARGQYPAVDILQSISRLADKAWTPPRRQLARRLKAMIAEFEESRDLRLMGALKPGSNAELDKAVRLVPKLYELLAQDPGQSLDPDGLAALEKRIAALS